MMTMTIMMTMMRTTIRTYVRNGNDDDDDDDEDGNHDAIVIMGVRTYVRSVAINACHESILQGVASQLNQPLWG